MLFIGDVHGEFETYLFILQKMQHKGGEKGVPCSFQTGDMGLGFSDKNAKYSKNGKAWSPELGLEHKFIAGNHDDPALCRSHPNYLGEYGFLPKPNIFYVGGGYSIDQGLRTIDYNWWEDEELSEGKFGRAIDLYKKSKPKIMVSHECPLSMKADVITNSWKLEHDSRTEKNLQMMLDIHKPDYWIFGHHHRFLEKDVNGTHFVCLHELINGSVNDCIYEIPNLTWD